MANKFYMETKKNTLEQSVLDVWKEAAEMHAEGMDGRTKEYRSHRSKLETNRVHRENKKNTVKAEHGSGEHSFEVGTDRYAAYTELVTPGQVKEEIAKLDSLIEELEEGILGNIAKAAGKTVAKGAKSVAKKAKDKVVSKASGSKLGKKVAKVKAGVKKAKEIGGKVKKAVKTGTAYGDEFNPMLERLEVIESKLNEYSQILEEELEREENQMTENTSLRETIINMWKESASSAVNPNERDELDIDAKNSAKKMKHAKEPAPGQMTEGSKEEYTKFFNSAMKKFKINSPADLKSDEEKKKFYDYIDKNYTGEKDEEMIQLAKEFKVSSMREALAQVWGLDEYITKEGARRKVAGGDGRRTVKEKNKKNAEIDEWKSLTANRRVAGGDGRRTSKEDHKPGDDEDEDDVKKEKTLTGKKKSAVDVNPGLQS